jgi:hypothetical protein
MAGYLFARHRTQSTSHHFQSTFNQNCKSTRECVYSNWLQTTSQIAIFRIKPKCTAHCTADGTSATPFVWNSN